MGHKLLFDPTQPRCIAFRSGGLWGAVCVSQHSMSFLNHKITLMDTNELMTVTTVLQNRQCQGQEEMGS